MATLNTWGTRGDWHARLGTMRTEFAHIRADIITLQETVLTSEFDQTAVMLGGPYNLAQQSNRGSGDRGTPVGQGITTASRWPIGETVEVDMNVTDRTRNFACACLATEILAPEPLGRIWVANHFPDYQLDHEHERCLQARAVAHTLEQLLADKPGYVIVAGDMDADPASDSMRFWTGRHVIQTTSVCYRSAMEAVYGPHTIDTYTPSNPFQVDEDWPYQNINHVLVRCSDGGPTLLARSCRRAFDTGCTTASDHYGLVVDYDIAKNTSGLAH